MDGDFVLISGKDFKLLPASKRRQLTLTDQVVLKALAAFATSIYAEKVRIVNPEILPGIKNAVTKTAQAFRLVYIIGIGNDFPTHTENARYGIDGDIYVMRSSDGVVAVFESPRTGHPHFVAVKDLPPEGQLLAAQLLARSPYLPPPLAPPALAEVEVPPMQFRDP